MYYIQQAKRIAERIQAQLQPHCRKIDIAGSIRREKQEVKDIEIVCIPKTITTQAQSLFNFEPPVTKVSPEFIKAVGNIGKVQKGNPEGRYMQIYLPHDKINLDLFLPEPCDYYRQFCIRTGSAEYVMKNIASGWKRIGWCGSDKGLRRIDECTEHKTPDNKSRWYCTNPEAQLPPVWASEHDFFNWLGIAYVEPKNRV